MGKELKKIPLEQLDTVQYNPMVISEAYRAIEQGQKSLVFQSCESMGILYPILVFPANDQYFVIDGFKRVQFAQEKGQEAVLALVLPEETAASELWRLLLIEHLAAFTATDTTKALACHFLSYCGVSKQDVRTLYAAFLGLQSHDQIMRNCFKVAKLSKPILEFTHEKKLSLKQCMQLAQYPEEIVITILSWRRKMILSASMVMGIADFLQTQLHRKACSLKELLAETHYQDVLSGDADPNRRTKRLKELMDQETHPTLRKINDDIEGIAEEMGLPKSVSVSWDRTLENRAVNFAVSVSSTKELSAVQESFTIEKLQQPVADILEKL